MQSLNSVVDSSSRVSAVNSRRRAMIAAAAGLAVAGIAGRAHAQALNPISVTGFTQDVVAETSPASSSTTASFDAYNGYVFYPVGYPGSDGSTGLPSAPFVSQANSNTTFQLANFASNNVLLFNTATNAGGAPQVSSGSIKLANPAAYSSLALLNADANGGSTINYTLDFADGTTATGSFAGQDWYYNYPYAISNIGRVSVSNSGDVEDGQYPALYESDIAIPGADATKVLDQIDFSTSGSGYQWGLFAVSGAVTPNPEVYVGTDPNNPANNGKVDYTSLTFSTGNGASPALAGQPITFDDTATGPTTNILIGAGGIAPGSVTFDNSQKSYSFQASGGGINGTGGVTLNGTGSVTFNNVNGYTGDTVINSGTLVIGPGGSLASPTVVVNGSGATFNIASGGQTGGTPIGVIDTGTVNIFNTTQVLGALVGNGVVNLNGTALTVGVGTDFSGTINGTGSLDIEGGSVIAQSASSLAGITGSISVGLGNNSSALIIGDNSGTGFSGTRLILGPSGTLASTAGTPINYAGPIVLASTLAFPATIAEDGATFTNSNPITGTGSLSLAGTNGASFQLNAANTYAGDTIVNGDPVGQVPYNTITVTLNNDSGISPNGGLIVNTSAGGLLNVDLNGRNPTVQFLSGSANANYALINGGPSTSTLTITNVNTSGGVASFGTAISGNIALVKAGTTGNQILTGNNTYTGGTRITGGTLTAGSSSALGNGPVTLAGGTLSLSAAPTNLSGFAGFQLNTNGASQPSISSDKTTLTLTNSVGGEAASAFYAQPATFLPNGNFTASFFYNPNYGGADGLTFTIQSDPRAAGALGGSGGSLGYSGIQNSVSLQFDIYNAGGYGLGTDGAINKDQFEPNSYIPAGINVTLSYSGSTQTLTENFSDPYGDSDSQTYNVNLASLLGGTTGFVGFTAGDGGENSTQQVSDFTFSDGTTATPVSLTSNNLVTTAKNTTSTLSVTVATGANQSTLPGGLNIASGSVLHVVSVASTTGTRLVLTTPTLTIDGTTGASTGTLDLQNNDLDITGGSLAAVTAEVGQGYNLVGGANWQGKGITSTTAAADTSHLTALGVIQNSVNGVQLYGATTPLGLFDGISPGAGDILVKYTYFGDANLDGKVDGSDYSLIDAGYGSHGTLSGWLNGDFNYDGVIDGSDYALIDNAFNNQAAPLTSAAEVATDTAQVAASPAAVPEPASLGMIAVGTLALIRRRRQA